MRSKGISMHNMHFECGQCALFQITIDEYSARPEQQRLLESEQKRAIKLVEGIFHRGLLQICCRPELKGEDDVLPLSPNHSLGH